LNLSSKKIKKSLNNEINKYLDFIQIFCPEISEQELHAFGSLLVEKRFQKNDIIFSAEEIQKEMGFITNGLVRGYYVNETGKEKTIRFQWENGFLTHYVAFITQQPCRYNLVCLEPTIAIMLSYEDLQIAYNTLPSIQKFGRLMAEEILKMHQYRIESFIFMTAEERYLDFIEQNPHLVNRVSLSHLCSFLGIERQTLTRIRQKLAGKPTF
jgi:CRP/FNR family transcriptional regulator, anaerobic regulatory protein